MTTEKTPGELLYRSIAYGHSGISESRSSSEWDNLRSDLKEVWEKGAAAVSAPLIERIAVLEAEVAHWRRKSDDPSYRWTGKCLLNDMKFNPPSPDMIEAMRIAAEWHGGDFEDGE